LVGEEETFPALLFNVYKLYHFNQMYGGKIIYFLSPGPWTVRKTYGNEPGRDVSISIEIVIRPGLSHIAWKRINTVQNSPGVLNLIFLCVFYS